MERGDVLPDFSLNGVDGRQYSPRDFSKELLLVVFTCNHCPYAQAYDARLKAIALDYVESCDVVFINSNDGKSFPADSFDEMVRLAKTKKFAFPYLHDCTQQVARAFGAKVTPHVFLFDNDRKLRYSGAIDDNWREPDLAVDRYVHDAIAALITHDEPPCSYVEPVGCTVKWL